MNDLAVIWTLINKYIVGHKLSYVEAKNIMFRNGMTMGEYEQLCDAVYKLGKGREKWPEFVISAVKNSDEDSK